MSIFDNFDKIARRYPEVYGYDKSEKKRQQKKYLRQNPDSYKMKVYEAINDLYKKYDNAREDKKGRHSKQYEEMKEILRVTCNENYLLKKEISELKNIILYNNGLT
jgi:alpha-ketoglutarate-dependent taurine dioxygenase